MNASPSNFPADPTRDRLLVSVVVIGRNEGARLRDCFTSIKNIEHEGYDLEYIYSDSGSTDNSLEIAAEFGIPALALKPEFPTAALGRNAGWRASKGDFILFLDGDSAVEPDFLSQALPWFEDPKLAVLFGWRRERYPEHSIFNRVLDLDWCCDIGIAPFCGGDAIFRRKVLEQTGGYDYSLIAGEEPDLCRRLRDFGYYIRCVEKVMSKHDLAMYRWKQYWRRLLRAGHAFAEISARYRNTSEPIWLSESRHNMAIAVIQTIAMMLTLVLIFVLHSLWPLVVLGIAAMLLTLNTMWRRSYLKTDRFTLLLYSIHGHMQQIPIAVGQIGWLLTRKRQQRLIEYK
jgi:cellulose synthase/poly-beta-1,6-N-acetylglucosamine synthase-like glycosyltransferase